MNKKVISIVAIIALVAILGVCLVACNADSYAKKLEKAGYEVVVAKGDETGEEGAEWMVTATKAEGLLNINTVTIVKYANTDDAKEAEEAAIAIFGESCVYRSGKIVMAGTEQGIKDAK